MTYKIDAFVSKFISPVIVILPDGNKLQFSDGKELSQKIFDRHYSIEMVSSVDNSLQIQLVEITNSFSDRSKESIFDGA